MTLTGVKNHSHNEEIECIQFYILPPKEECTQPPNSFISVHDYILCPEERAFGDMKRVQGY